jgi:hypothetical protein
MSALNIIEKHNANITERLEEIARIEKSVKGAKSRLINTFTKHFVDTPLTDLVAIAKCIGNQSTITLITKVATARLLNDDDITRESLFHFERMRDKQRDKFEPLLQATFENLSPEKKLMTATFCAGFISLYKLFPFLGLWLNKTYGLHIDDYASQNRVDFDAGYNMETSQCVMQIKLHRNKTDDLKDMATNMVNLINTQYRLDHIEVFERTCERFDKINLTKDHHDHITAVTIKKDSYSDNTCFEGDAVSQMTQALTYCSKYLWYSSDSEETEEDEDECACN